MWCPLCEAEFQDERDIKDHIWNKHGIKPEYCEIYSESENSEQEVDEESDKGDSDDGETTSSDKDDEIVSNSEDDFDTNEDCGYDTSDKEFETDLDHSDVQNSSDESYKQSETKSNKRVSPKSVRKNEQLHVMQGVEADADEEDLDDRLKQENSHTVGVKHFKNDLMPYIETLKNPKVKLSGTKSNKQASLRKSACKNKQLPNKQASLPKSVCKNKQLPNKQASLPKSVCKNKQLPNKQASLPKSVCKNKLLKKLASPPKSVYKIKQLLNKQAAPHKSVCKNKQLHVMQGADLGAIKEDDDYKPVKDECPESVPSYYDVSDPLPLPHITGGFNFNSRNILIWLLKFKEMNRKFRYPLHPRLFDKIQLIHKDIFASFCNGTSNDVTRAVMKVYEELDSMINRHILSINERLK